MEAAHNHRVGFGTAALGDQAVEVSKKKRIIDVKEEDSLSSSILFFL